MGDIYERDSKLKAFPCDRALCVRKNRCRVPVQTTDHQLAFPSCSRQSFRLALDKLNLWSPLIADKPNHNDSIFSLTMVLEEDERTGRGIPHISSTFNNKLVARLIMMVLLIMIEIVSCSPANQSGGQVELRPWGHHELPTGVRHGQPRQGGGALGEGSGQYPPL